MSSWIGQYLLKRHNIFVNTLMPMAVGDRSVLTPEVMTHYGNALSSPEARAAMAAFPDHIVGASDWLDSIWRGRRGFRGQACIHRMGTPGHRVPEEGARPVEVDSHTVRGPEFESGGGFAFR